MKPLLTSFATKLAYFIAALIIFAAVLVTTSRMITPVLDSNKIEIENWASKLLGFPVSFQHAEISWYQYQPVVNFTTVTLYNNVNKQPSLQIQKVAVAFSIPASLWNRALTPSVVYVNGSEINVHEAATGEISVQGFPTLIGKDRQPFQTETRLNDMLAWLSIQPRITLQNIDVRYTGINKQKRYVTIYNLNLRNGGTKHYLSGRGILHQQQPTEVNAAVEWEGSSFNLADINANIYVYATGLSLAQWMQGLNWKGWELKSGIASAKVWATWNQGEFQKIQSLFVVHQLNLSSPKNNSSQYIDRLSGNVGFSKKGPNEYIIAGEDILIDLPDHLWPVTNFYTVIQKSNNQWLPTLLNIGYLDLKDFAFVTRKFPFLFPENLVKTIANLHPSGSLYNIALGLSTDLQQWQKTSINANFRGLSFKEWQTYPGIENFSGVANWDGQKGYITLDSKRAEYTDSKIFNNKIFFNRILGRIDIEYLYDKNSWQFTSPLLQLNSNDLAVNIKGNFLMTPSDQIADLAATFILQRANQITRYLPAKFFDPDLNLWLKQAFVAGNVKSGVAKVKGNLKDFPFGKNNGEFLMSGDIEGLNLNYADDWSQIKNIHANLTFSANKMFAKIFHAEMLGMSFSNIDVNIPYISEKADIFIRSEVIDTDFAHAIAFIKRTPLQTTIGKIFDPLDLSGPFSLKLALKVPIQQPKNTSVLGDLKLQDNNAALNSLGLTINKLNGQIRFTENGADARNIMGTLFNKPVTINLSTITKNKTTSFVRVNIKNKITVKDIETWLNTSLKIAKGEAQLNTQIDAHLDEPVTIQLKSDLFGLQLDLPEDLSKKVNEKRVLIADVTIPEANEIRVKLNYQPSLQSAFILQKENRSFKLTSANINLNAGNATWPKQHGIFITADYEELSWEKIKNYINTSGESDISLPLKSIKINAKNIKIAGQEFPNTQIQLESSNTYWDVNIKGQNIAGNLLIPKKFNNQESLHAEFERLHLNVPSDKVTATNIDVRNLPAIDFRANNLIYDHIQLGNVFFKAVPSKNGMQIQALRVLSRYFNLQGSGDWSHDNVTRLHGIGRSPNVTGMLTNFGFDVHNFIAEEGSVRFNLSWQDAPYAPSLASLSGNAHIEIGKGRIVDVGQESEAKMDLGRLLSVFSLRRLSLDFRDVFQKGYSFDSIRGNFNFKNGNAFTNDLRIDGPVAKVTVDGRIGLQEKDLDLRLTVTADVTSSIPVAAALITVQPLVGIAAFAVNSLIGPQVSKLTTYLYQVKGPWNNASWAPMQGRR